MFDALDVTKYITLRYARTAFFFDVNKITQLRFSHE